MTTQQPTISAPAAAQVTSTKTESKLGLGLLIALVVGSILSSGIFCLPQNMAAGVGAGAIVIGWLISGAGMLTFALVYQMIALRKSDLDNGIYAYARAMSGEYVGRTRRARALMSTRPPLIPKGNPTCTNES